MMVSLMMIMRDFWLMMRFFSVAAYVCVCSKSSIRPNPSRSSFTTRALEDNLKEEARLQMKLIPVQM